jgi:hypothetical protein
VLPGLEGDLHGDLDGRRAVVAVEDAVQSGRRDAHELCGERRGGLVRDAGERAMRERLCLLAQRAHEARMAVAQCRDPPGGVAVEVAGAVGVVE